MIDPQGAAAPSTPEPPGTDATAVSDQTVMTVDAGPTTTTVVDAPNETSTALTAEESAAVAEETARGNRRGIHRRRIHSRGTDR